MGALEICHEECHRLELKVVKLQAKIAQLEEGAFAAREEVQIRNDRIEQLKEQKRGLEEENAGLLKLTELLDEHPEGYDGPCLCKLCMSYG